MPQSIKTDVEIQGQVLDELKWDSRINRAEIGENLITVDPAA